MTKRLTVTHIRFVLPITELKGDLIVNFNKKLINKKSKANLFISNHSIKRIFMIILAH